MEDIIQLFRLIGVGVVLMLPLGNPLTSMSMLLAQGGHLSQAERNQEINKATFYVMLIMLVTFYAGAAIMHSFGISIPGLRMAGGLIVAFIGFTMLFPSSAVDAAQDAEAAVEAGPANARKRGAPRSIAFVPLALPGTAGPGCIAMIISLGSKVHAPNSGYEPWMLAIAAIVVVAILGLIFWVCLRFSFSLVRFLGVGGIDAISRIMGFLLVCIGVQFVMDGVRGEFFGVPM